MGIPARKSDLLQGLADRVNRAAGRTVRSIVETGQALLASKAKAGHGGWERLFDHAALERPIRFSIRTARRYMTVAECSAIAKADDLSVFPPAVAILEALAKLPDEILRAALRDSRINPEMETRDVAKLYAPPALLRPTAAALVMGTPRLVTYEVLKDLSSNPTTVILNGGPDWNPRAARERLMAAIKLEFEREGCCREDRPVLANLLRGLARDIDAGTHQMALGDKYGDVPALPQADRVTAIVN